MEKESIAKAPRGRTTRTPIGTRNVLTVQGKDPNYVYRIVNDSGDRVQMFLDAGYEVCAADEVRVGDKRVQKASPTGSSAEVAVGAGQKALVMKQRKDWYDEDQAAKQSKVNELESTMQKSARDNGFIGKIETTRR